MSDSSEDEDLSKFREAVDTSFVNSFKKENKDPPIANNQKKSERYLETVSHYNDVKAPEALQRQIGAKISAIINKNVEFVNVKCKQDTKRSKIKGGVKLFKNSENCLVYDIKDTYTDINSYDIQKIKKKMKTKENGVESNNNLNNEECPESVESNEMIIPEVVQEKVGAKLSDLISKNVEFVDKELGNKIKKYKIKNIKLFKNSKEFMTCDEIKDTYTEVHNKESKKIKKKRRIVDSTENELNDDEKVAAATISGDYILSKDETKLWKSRRKEKLFKYKSVGKSRVLTAVE